MPCVGCRVGPSPFPCRRSHEATKPGFCFCFCCVSLVSLVPVMYYQEICWEERLRSDPFSVEWDVKQMLPVDNFHT